MVSVGLSVPPCCCPSLRFTVLGSQHYPVGRHKLDSLSSSELLTLVTLQVYNL